MTKMTPFARDMIVMGGIFLICAIGCYASSMTLTYLHENVHQMIFKDYGINSTIIYGPPFGLGAKTVPVAGSKSCATHEMCNLAHSINEAVGYSLYPFVLMFWSGMFLMMILFYLTLEGRWLR